MILDCDYLVIGAGSAGCVIARRLAGAGRTILLEAGPAIAGKAEVEDISRWTGLLGSALDWDYPNSAMGPVSNPAIRHSRGRMMGGSGSHNNCIAYIPPDEDFADWEAAGATGWNAASMRPWFTRMLERVTVTHPERADPLSGAAVEAFRQLGVPAADWRAPAAHGAGLLALSAVGRIRQSSEMTYLRGPLPATLRILPDTPATRLVFDESGAACGAETPRGTIRAAREVVVCGGAFESPKLLLLSGIGPTAELADLGIACRADLPVGRNLMDHPEAAAIFRSRHALPETVSNYADAGAVLALTPGTTRPDILFHVAWSGYDYAHIPGFASVPGGICLAPNVARPKSRGRLSLVSPDWRDKPKVAMNMLSDDEGKDEALLVAAHRYARRLAQTPALAPWIAEQVYPAPALTSDEEIAGFIRQVCGVSYHPMGSCPIGPVLDPQLRVLGVPRLRVADASVFPTPISVNLNLVTMALAERAAALIAG